MSTIIFMHPNGVRPEAIHYRQDQQDHQRTMPFQEEFRKFLHAYEIAYDER